jgi:hypothetical protein
VSAGWVAASVRARAMACRQVGPSGARRLATAPSLAEARARLAGTCYADAVTAPPGLAPAQHAVSTAVLWQLRVLAGWLPAGGTRVARALVAGYERENVVAYLRWLQAARVRQAAQVFQGAPEPEPAPEPAPAPFELGSLSTAWTRLRRAPDAPALLAGLARSPWGAVDSPDPARVRDTLTAVWLRRLATEVPASRPWAVRAAVLHLARVRVVQGHLPGPRSSACLDALLGPRWRGADSLAGLRERLGPPAHRALEGVPDADRLWWAEAGLWATLAEDGARLLHRGTPGPEQVAAAAAVLAADAFRIRAALVAAAVGGGAGEVLERAG